MRNLLLLFIYFIYTSIILDANEDPIKRNIRGNVASAHPLATQAGLDILEKGGNAFDAAIAVASTLNVVEPMMSGIGGYGTILIYDSKQKKIRFLNASGRFPIKTNSDLMRAPSPDYMKNRMGPKSISTPGNLNAWEAMHKQYGVLPWNRLFEKAILHAENGFKVTGNGAQWIADAFENFSEYSKSFYGKNGRPLSEGDMLVQTDLAKTFSLIAKEGVEPFYRGKIAESIDKQMIEIGSFLSLEDLQRDRAEWWSPIKLNYKGYDVYTAGLPANSFAAFFVLGLMEHFDVDNSGHNSSNYLHFLAETAKESYKARLAYSYDPEVKTISLDSILSKDALASKANSIDRTKASDFTLPSSPESRNTTHFVVIDSFGNIVSATQTLGNMFGSRIMIEGTGIWMNSSMAFSTFEPKGNPMDVFPGRHKLSGDCPIIIMKDDEPWAALGTPGGHTITQNVPQIIFNLIDFNMAMQKAIDSPKIAFIEPDLIRFEKGISEEAKAALQIKGHRIEEGTIGNANGIRILRNQNNDISFDVGIDKRRDGQSSIFNSSM